MTDLAYISKAAALIALDSIQYWNPEDRYRAKKAIYELPPDEVCAVRQATWKAIAEPSPFEIVYACSCCGRTLQVEWNDHGIYERFPYCHCGAKMIKEV